MFEELQIIHEIAKSNSPNIIELIETFEDNDCYYVVTKFMQAGDLFNYITKQQETPLRESFTKKLIYQVCQGVQALHSRNIVHRDIKLENILMSSFAEDAQLRIADLGSAFKLESAEHKTRF